MQKYDYRITLTLFADLISGAGVQDDYVYISSFDKAANTLLDTFALGLSAHYDIKYDTSLCQFIAIRNRILTYSRTVTLDSNRYNGYEGSYLVWERCCRNSSVINIVNSFRTGTAFYTEFPPVKTYINSSPVFSLPNKNSYACYRSPFAFDFSASDADGDSLAYEIVVPFKGHADYDHPIPLAQKAPYAEVDLASGFSVANLISGLHPLSIDQNGLLQFNANRPGYYVFGVKCTEYRNKVEIGSVRRDYQIAILSCMKNPKPNFKFVDTLSNLTYNSGDTIPLDFSDPIHLSCIKLMASTTISGQNFSFQAFISNSGPTIEFLNTSYYIKSPTDTAKTYMCLLRPDCIDSAFKVTVVILSSNSCTESRYDTITVYIKNVVKPIIEHPSYFLHDRNTGINYYPEDTIPAEVFKNSYPYFERVSDFILENIFGAKLNVVYTFSNSKVLNFTSAYHKYNLSRTIDTALFALLDFRCFFFNTPTIRLKIIYTSHSLCNDVIHTDSVFYIIKGLKNQIDEKHILVEYIDNGITKQSNLDTTISLSLEQPNCLKFIGEYVLEDQMYAKITLSISASNFFQKEYPDVSSVFQTFSAVQNYYITYCMPKCPVQDSLLKLKIVNTVVSECHNRIDSFYLNIRNSASQQLPNIQTNLPNNSASLIIGETIAFDVMASADQGRKVAISKNSDVWNGTFYPSSENGSATGQYTFTPTCENLKFPENTLNFSASVESTCYPEGLNKSLEVKLMVKDTAKGQYKEINIITPNNDNINDYFEIPDLPIDNCSTQFIDVSLYNRWGSLIYREDKRTFKWDASGVPDGLYYYVITYTNTDYKSWLMVER